MRIYSLNILSFENNAKGFRYLVTMIEGEQILTKKKKTDLLLRHFLPYRLVLVARKVSESLSEVYDDEFGITVAEWRVLAHLGEHKTLNAKAIGDMAAMDKSMVSRAIMLLENKEILSKEKNQADSRALVLRLTRKGRYLYQKLTPMALQWESKLLQALTLEETRMLFTCLSKLESRLLDFKLNTD